MAAKMNKADLEAIKLSGYIRDGFGSLGITAGKPYLSDGVVCVYCYGIHPMDILKASDRIAQAMGSKGWSVDVWFDEWDNELKVSQKEKEN